MKTNKERRIIKEWLETGYFSTQVYLVLSNKIKSFVYSKNSIYSKSWLTTEELEEEVQKILIKLHNNRNSIEYKGVYSFIQTTVKNHLIDAHRKYKAKKNKKNICSFDDGEIEVDRIKEMGDNSLENIINSIDKKTIESFENKIKQRVFRWKKWRDINAKYEFPKISTASILSSYIGISQSDYNFYKNPSKRLLRYSNWKFSDYDTTGYMSMSINEMKKSLSENREEGKIDPMVGAVLVDNKNQIIATSFRGEVEKKGHSEYNLIENKIDEKFVKRRYIVPKGKIGEGASVTELSIKDATLFVTLEPCSKRGYSKCSYADRIIYSKGIKTVYIGLKDPDNNIDGVGIKKLEEAGIVIKSYPINLVVDIIKAISVEDGTNRNLDFILSKNKFYLDNQPEIFVEILKR